MVVAVRLLCNIYIYTQSFVHLYVRNIGENRRQHIRNSATQLQYRTHYNIRGCRKHSHRAEALETPVLPNRKGRCTEQSHNLETLIHDNKPTEISRPTGTAQVTVLKFEKATNKRKKKYQRTNFSRR